MSLYYTKCNKPIFLKDKITLKSYWFKTFSFPDFTKLYKIFYEKNKKIGNKRVKSFKKGIITDYLTPAGFAYWIMCDGSLQNNGKTLQLHSQSFTFEENQQLRYYFIIPLDELNKKFKLHSYVIPHKTIYYIIEIPNRDYQLLYELVNQFMIPSLMYKIVKTNNA